MDWLAIGSGAESCNQVRRSIVLALMILGLFILRAAIPAVAADKLDKLRIAYVSPIGAMAPIWMATASSAFHNEALDVELVLIQASAAIAAIVAGEVDAVQISAPSYCSGGARGREYHYDSRTAQ